MFVRKHKLADVFWALLMPACINNDGLSTAAVLQNTEFNNIYISFHNF